MESKAKQTALLKRNTAKSGDAKRLRQPFKPITSNVVNSTKRTANEKEAKPAVIRHFGNEKEMAVQDECFTPRRSLCRTPPLETGSGAVLSADITPIFHLRGSKSYSQASETRKTLEPKLVDAVPPPSKRDLSRTPITKTSLHVKDDKGQSSPTTQSCQYSSKKTSSDASAASSVQKSSATWPDCFTPSPKTKRSPVKVAQKEIPQSDLASAVPPLAKFEIPRTPLPKSRGESLADPLPAQAGMVSHQMPTDSSLKGSMQQEEYISTGTINETSDDQNTGVVHFTTSHNQGTTTADSENQIQLSALVPFLNPSAPTGLDCTENDIAFLRKMRNVRHYEYLETQAAQLDKGIKDASIQKELLESEAQKVKQDLIDMRTKYYKTIASIQTLISNPNGTTSEQAPDADDLGPVSHVHVARLKQMQQTSSVLLEKADKELRTRLLEVEETKEKLHSQIRDEEHRIEHMKQRRIEIQHSEAQKSEWENRLQQLQSCHREIKEKLSQSQALFITLKEGSGERQIQAFLEEKKRAEERLQHIIRHCELCVKRHKMLKDMKIVS